MTDIKTLEALINDYLDKHGNTLTQWAKNDYDYAQTLPEDKQIEIVPELLQAINLYIEDRERLARKAFLNELVEEIDNLDVNDSVAMSAIRNVLSQLKELEG